MSRKILILGATSAIARASAIAFAKMGDELFLAGRNTAELERIACDLTIRFNNINHFIPFDIEKISEHKTFHEEIIKRAGHLDGIVFAIGYMNKNPKKVFSINFTGAVSIIQLFADYFEQQQKGFIIGITSVAGDRGRQSNYLYGAAKSGLSTYLSGLRNRLFKSNVRVITIKPGFVDTAMTFGLPGLFLVAKPETIGNAIAKSINKKSDVVYLPWFWQWIMLIIKLIPEPIFKRLSL